jgi:hypothetical protein
MKKLQIANSQYIPMGIRGRKLCWDKMDRDVRVETSSKGKPFKILNNQKHMRMGF